MRRAEDAEQGRPGRTEADLRPALEGPEGLGGRAVAVARCSGTGPGAGHRAVGEARDLGVEGAVCGASSQPCQGGRSKAFLDAAGLVLIITPEMVLAFLVVYSCFVGAS